ncbi:cell division protein FtsH [Corallococcus sp. H22C18031201]|uniref:ATP-dependent zinc metalloprotease FtsH n=1 Tax=Citreicoccus inhibens TaxID=2849499 RepID=UPI000E76FA8F|nr:ATP-dependent zinc metalloprotease FtsH [Citreicoccus inhibens]MBU8897014.1 ATP-dependent zinc metalloprotease FtsH [Citreicoccus inhibens]RJS19640.1 cell division protein FtsH [Corallococcus sp. H22C18031201]
MGPRGKKPDKPTPARGGFKFGSPLGYILLLVLGFLLFRNVFQDAGVRRVSYSQLRDAIENGQFSRVQISNEWVKGFLKENAQPPAGEQKTLRSEPSALPWMAYRVPGDDELIPLLEEKGIQFEAVPQSSFSEVLWIWLLPMGLLILFWSFMMRRMTGGMGQGPQSVMSFGKTRAKVQAESDTGVGFKDVAGVDEAVDELREIVEFLKTPEKFRRLGGRIPKGVLLVGPPGTGKTLLARAVAGEAGVPFFSLSGSEFVEMFVGVGAARVRDLFAQATSKAPCIIFIDELDAIGKSRNAGIAGGHDEREQTLNQLLAEMDGFDSRAGLIILAATNRPEILDSALMRPGRFDRQVLVDRPDKRGRERVLEIHSRGVKLGPDVDLRVIASRTPGFVGADLANVVNEAALLAARRNRDAVMRADFEEAIERVVAGLEKKNRRMNEREKEIVAHHEAGHAVVGWMLPYAERVTKVSIIPRGLAALGYTMSLPLEDRYLMSLEELRDKMAGMMGGRAAEELFVGEISTGASNDLKQATEIARMMVRDYGMSSLGPVALGSEHGPGFLRSAGLPETRSYSEQTARMIDEEVHKMVAEALERARHVLNTHRDKVQAVAARLLATEVIEEDTMVTILGPKVVAERGLLHPEARAVISAHPVAPTEPETPPTQHTDPPLDA